MTCTACNKTINIDQEICIINRHGLSTHLECKIDETTKNPPQMTDLTVDESVVCHICKKGFTLPLSNCIKYPCVHGWMHTHCVRVIFNITSNKECRICPSKKNEKSTTATIIAPYSTIPNTVDREMLFFQDLAQASELFYTYNEFFIPKFETAGKRLCHELQTIRALSDENEQYPLVIEYLNKNLPPNRTIAEMMESLKITPQMISEQQ